MRGYFHGRDSWNDQRIASSLAVQGMHGFMDGAVEGVGVSEGLVGEMMRLEIVPDDLDVVEFGRVFWQPLDGEPMLARVEGGKGELADVDRSIVLDQHDRLHGPSGLGAKETVELLQVSDEVAAALGRAGVHDELARDMIERADHRHFLGLPRRRHTQVRAALGPRPRQIRVRQGLALVAVEQDDVAGLGLGLAQLQAQAHALDLGGDLAAFSVCRGRRQRKFFFAAPWTVATCRSGRPRAPRSRR